MGKRNKAKAKLLSFVVTLKSDVFFDKVPNVKMMDSLSFRFAILSFAKEKMSEKNLQLMLSNLTVYNDQREETENYLCHCNLISI
jgi:hypothetical protein